MNLAKENEPNNLKVYINNCLDPEVDTWLLMSSPTPVLMIVAVYLMFVLKLGPKIMEKRPAYELKTILILYNASQVLFSIWLTVIVRKFIVFQLNPLKF